MSLGFNSPDTTIGWIGNGGILISKLDSNDMPVGGFFNVGQLSSAVLSLSSDKVEMQDMVYGTLGVAKSKVIKNSGEVTLSLRSYSPEVMEMALFGKTTKDVAKVGEMFSEKAYKSRSIVVPGIISAVTSISNGAETLDEGTDYVVSNGSIYFPETSSIVDGDSVTVVYDRAAVTRVEGMVNTGVSVMVVFDGLNLGTDGEDLPVKVTYYKLSLTPAASRQLVSADYGDQEIKGTLQVSKAVSGSGLSKMFKEEHIKAV